MITIEAAVEALRAARHDRRTVPAFSLGHPSLDEDWAYAAQDLDLRLRRQDGEVVVGRKLGLTSAAKQAAMHVDRPIFGILTDVMQRHSLLRCSDFGQPRAEPEVVFQLAKPINRQLERDQLAPYIAAVAVGMEIIDSRYSDYRFGFADVVADSTSAAAFAIGTWMPWTGLDLTLLTGSIAEDGAVVHRAPLSAVLEDPLQALVLLSAHVAARCESVDAGSIILSGAITDAIPVRPGHRYTAAITSLGEVSLDAV